MIVFFSSRDRHERFVADIGSQWIPNNRISTYFSNMLWSRQEKRETIWVFGRKHVGAISWGRTIAFGICVFKTWVSPQWKNANRENTIWSYKRQHFRYPISRQNLCYINVQNPSNSESLVEHAACRTGSELLPSRAQGDKNSNHEITI